MTRSVGSVGAVFVISNVNPKSTLCACPVQRVDVTSMTTFKCTFVQDWTNPEHCQFAAWVRPVESNTNAAYCVLCRKQFSLSNMGRRALTSHAESKKHRLAATGAATPSVTSFFTTPARKPPAAIMQAGPVASSSAPPPLLQLQLQTSNPSVQQRISFSVT